MKTLKLLVGSLSLAGLLFTSACGNSAIKEFESVVDEVCKCKDLECAMKAISKMEKIKEPKELSDSDKKKVKELGEKMEKCMENIKPS